MKPEIVPFIGIVIFAIATIAQDIQQNVTITSLKKRIEVLELDKRKDQFTGKSGYWTNLVRGPIFYEPVGEHSYTTNN